MTKELAYLSSPIDQVQIFDNNDNQETTVKEEETVANRESLVHQHENVKEPLLLEDTKIVMPAS